MIRINPRYTTQKCSRCGELVQKSLSVRTHVCPVCGYVADRNVNAAQNILKAGAQPSGMLADGLADERGALWAKPPALAARSCHCYDHAARSRDTVSIGYHGARLAAYGATNPDRLAGVLARAMERRNVADWALEHELGVDEVGLLRLALSPRPRPAQIDDDIALMVTATCHPWEEISCHVVAVQSAFLRSYTERAV